MAYTNGTFVWYELVTTDKNAASDFFGDVIGWTVNKMDMGPGGTYHAIANGENTQGGYVDAPEGVPSHWLSYLAVADVDATLKLIQDNEGKLLQGPMDIPGVGRMATVADPQGATFSIWTSNGDDNSKAASAVGGFHWTELWAKDVNAALPFYKTVFGYETSTMSMPDGDYYILLNDGQPIGGAMTSREEKAPAMWLPWLQVDSIENTLTKVNARGGKVIAPSFEVPGVGQLAIISDNTSAVVGVIVPAEQK